MDDDVVEEPVPTSSPGYIGLQELGESIDLLTFEQILEMDDDEDERDFSKSIVYGFFEQAEATFEKMDKNLAEGNLHDLSQLGHFLKGSSATLGLTGIRNSCEKIQHWGQCQDEKGERDENSDFCLNAIKDELGKLRKEYQKDERALRKYYGEKLE